mmetsp:Transcript_2475/g.3383  ORF Transcript_2475/g.3383 Transcript_2475/m.3383 type:complete len:83 (-) Transcript_2475:1215-1463(-)
MPSFCFRSLLLFNDSFHFDLLWCDGDIVISATALILTVKWASLHTANTAVDKYIASTFAITFLQIGHSLDKKRTASLDHWRS